MAQRLSTRQRLALLEGHLPPRTGGLKVRDLPHAEIIAGLLVGFQDLAGRDDDRARRMRGLYALQLHALLPGPHQPTGNALAALTTHAQHVSAELGTMLAPGWMDAVAAP